MLALGILAVGCSSSHAVDCPDVAGSCMTACCVSVASPTFDEACNPICPSGTSLIDRCTPGADCGCPPDDAGLLLCYGGACCTDEAAATINADCAWECPAGFSFECAPDPTAVCDEPWLACESPSDCILAPAGGCCFPCGDSLALEQVTAIGRDGAEAYYEHHCPGELECPPCVPASNASLQATCNDAGRCEAFDVRRLDLSACTSDDECRLRVPDCCECGADPSAERLIAVNADEVGAYTALVCGPFDGACAPCAPVYPDAVEAYCASDGHCAVRTR